MVSPHVHHAAAVSLLPAQTVYIGQLPASLECSVVVIPLTQGHTHGRRLWLSMSITRGQQLTLLSGRLPWPTVLAATTDHLPWPTALAAAAADRLPWSTAIAAAANCLPWSTAIAAAANCLPRKQLTPPPMISRGKELLLLPSPMISCGKQLLLPPPPMICCDKQSLLPPPQMFSCSKQPLLPPLPMFWLLLAQVYTLSHSFDCLAQPGQNGVTWQTPS
jgi:hypothetical protein